ncbi:MAG: alpha/beta hydrolase family protein [Akkermansiaceae bacterium]
MTTILHALVPAILLIFSGNLCAEKKEPFIAKGSKKLPLPGESFKLNGRDAFIILPEQKTTDLPWVWYAPTLRGLPSKAEVWMFQRFLDSGVAIAGIDVGESYGSPEGRKGYSEFYQHLVTNRGFSAKPCLLARSRGGLMLYNWAVENPHKVSGVAGIYPVCNLESYPGLARAAGAYQLTAEKLKEQLGKQNPIERLASLAKVRVPVFHLHGDNDKVVPLEANTAILEKRYLDLGGPITVEVVKGGGHDMWKGWFQSEALTNFVIKRARPR